MKRLWYVWYRLPLHATNPKHFGNVILPLLFKTICKSDKQLDELPFFSMKAAMVKHHDELANNIINICVFVAGICKQPADD